MTTLNSHPFPKQGPTPGPWSIQPAGPAVPADATIYSARSRAPIAEVISVRDASLIAAAPDLLDALLYLRNCIEAGTEPGMGLVHRAIDKAEGRS